MQAKGDGQTLKQWDDREMEGLTKEWIDFFSQLDTKLKMINKDLEKAS